MPNEIRGRLDNAIDRTVRRMMQVDPQPGFRHRVVGRLEARARRPWLVPAFAIAVLAVVTASLLVLRTSPSPAPASPQVVTAPPAFAPPQPAAASDPREAPAPAPQAAASAPVASQERRSRPVTSVPARGESIFGPPSQRVTATSLGAATVPPDRLPRADPPADTTAHLAGLEPIAPIVIEPIVIPPISITPLIVRTPDRR